MGTGVVGAIIGQGGHGLANDVQKAIGEREGGGLSSHTRTGEERQFFLCAQKMISI